MASSTDEFEVARIAGRCYIKNVAYFLIEWKGYEPQDNTWERKDNLLGNDSLIAQFLRNYRNENPGKPIIRHETLLLKDAHDAERPSIEDLVEPVANLAQDSSKPSKTNKARQTPTKKRATYVSDSLLPVSASDSIGNGSSVASSSNEVPVPNEFLDLVQPRKKAKKIVPTVVPEGDTSVKVIEQENTISDIALEEELKRVLNSVGSAKLKSMRSRFGLVKDSDGVLVFNNVYPPVSVANENDTEPFPKGFVYIDNLIFNPAVPKPDPAFLSGCDCTGRCRIVKGGKFCHEDCPYTNNGKLAADHAGAIYECNSSCSCDPTSCPNRVVQRGRTVPLEIFKTPKKGWGVRTKTALKKNTFVEEYLGEVITEEEGASRGKAYDKIGTSYLFDMDLAEGDDQKYVIDSYICGNSSHFFNHSCNPNLIVYGVFYDSMDPSFHRLAFFTNQDIPIGTELTFDYIGTDYTEDSFSNKFPCNCDSINCRNWIHI